jgi:hypothetical protein
MVEQKRKVDQVAKMAKQANCNKFGKKLVQDVTVKGGDLNKQSSTAERNQSDSEVVSVNSSDKSKEGQGYNPIHCPDRHRVAIKLKGRYAGYEHLKEATVTACAIETQNHLFSIRACGIELFNFDENWSRISYGRPDDDHPYRFEEMEVWNTDSGTRLGKCRVP